MTVVKNILKRLETLDRPHDPSKAEAFASLEVAVKSLAFCANDPEFRVKGMSPREAIREIALLLGVKPPRGAR